MYRVLNFVWSGFCLLFVLFILVAGLMLVTNGALECKPGPGPVCGQKVSQKQ